MSVLWCAMDLVPALEEPLKKVLGAATAKVMAEHLGLHTVGDLLHHYPRRYAERGRAHPPGRPAAGRARHGGRPGRRRPPAHLQPRRRRGKGQRLEVTITDGSGRLQLVFFGNGVHKPHKELLPGTPRDVRRQGLGLQPHACQLAHPAYELLRRRRRGDGGGRRLGRRR